ncbi:MerR family transcriptional regulator [Campylobacter fetus]|uniref:MerR family transcriptional regulator n=1 Tax=Campylobacter fetus TaxID=196 RepID=UPI000FCBF619|nr:MerR family transcriptional regulator [Campylobacter fetus]QQF52514.1 MerR family transcriptional regulator [Campylobacter fetus subsp. venerealis]RUT49339.1 transcriptional regulator [Campylobacter fetus]RUT49598.1 transcriptional regulator [Campylobacter fetus]
MAKTIIDVEKKTGISSRTIRFWLGKGLFPFVERDKNGVNYFSDRDIEWVMWVDCFRKTGMSIEKIKHYITLAAKGKSSAATRLNMIEEQKAIIKAEIKKLEEIDKKLDYKIGYYKDMLANHEDTINPISNDYEGIASLKNKMKSSR